MGLLDKVKVTLESRHIFKNWLSLRIKYFLIRHNILKAKYLNIKLKNGKSINIPIRIYSLLINAFHEGLINKIEIIDNTLCLDGIIELRRLDDRLMYIMPDGIKLIADDEELLGSYGSTEFVTIYQTWVLRANSLDIDLSSSFVLDIGAFIGDTTLYFAKRGAFVVAVEPVPSHYKAILENMKYNPDIANNILPLNIALATEDGTIDIAIEGIAHGGASMYKNYSTKIKVKALSLKSLLNLITTNYNINLESYKNRVLKMDCEGCEYEVIMNHEDEIKLFNYLLIEYHGYLRNYKVEVLIKKLKSLGYVCEIFDHDPFERRRLRLGLDSLGTLKCSKIS